MKSRIKPMTPGIPHGARMRAYLAGAVLTFAIVGVAARAWGLQVGDATKYRELAARQHIAAVNIPAPRGDVIDVHARPLAVSADADSIWANPREIKDVTEAAEKLAALIAVPREGQKVTMNVDAQALEEKLGLDRRFVWIARHVPPELADRVRAAKLPGIVVVKEPRRFYPGKTIGGPVIGRADIDGKGLDGIELAQDKFLTGTRGAANAIRDSRGKRMFADGVAQPTPGATVKLTLDRSIQAIADQALADAVTHHKAKNGSVVVLDVATSRVLAMSSYPPYDSNTGEGIADGARNRPVTDAYEAGSVMKLFTVAAALDAGMINADSWFDTMGGRMQIGRKTIRDVHHDKALTTSGIIKRSSNVGAVKIAQRLGREKLHAAFKRFGFGEKSGIELPGEQRGRIRAHDSWREIELATISFGYGLTVTPLQIAAATAAIGNGGIYTPPRVIDSIIGADGEVVKKTVAEGRPAINAKSANALRLMMGTVFEGGKDGGTAASLVVPGFRCGGKTGTAHKWDHEAKKYAEKRYLSSMVGLAPLDKPRLAIVVLIDEPSGGDYYGGKVAGPVFATVASEALRYLGVPGESLVCPPPVPGVVINPLAVQPAKTCVTPSPKPVKGEPVPVLDEEAPDGPAIDAEDDEPADPTAIDIPDFRGMSLRKAMNTARDLGLTLDISGAGIVVGQDPLPGKSAKDTRVLLRFSDENP
jgi:cell division protein FtsI (penicillin-binding protein 3)